MHPVGVTTLALFTRYQCETFLKSGYRFQIDDALREKIINVNHPKNGTGMQCMLILNSRGVTIQLLVVLIRTQTAEHLGMARQQFLKHRMASPENTFLQESE